MKDKLVNRLSFGATVTVFLYVMGFLWQYAYLGSITDHVGWIKIVTVDYLYLGVMAVIFTVPPLFVALSVIFFTFFYSGILISFINNTWMRFLFIAYEKRGKNKFYYYADKMLSNGFRIDFFRFIFYSYVLLILFVLPSKVIANAKNHLAYRLSSGPVDMLCVTDRECHKGKILYTNDKQFYFYSYEGFTDYRKGRLLIIGINDASLSLGWYSKGKKQVEHIVEANKSE